MNTWLFSWKTFDTIYKIFTTGLKLIITGIWTICLFSGGILALLAVGAGVIVFFIQFVIALLFRED